nr:MAG TPA: hypothetical protein [Caudoviricetes sp.]
MFIDYRQLHNTPDTELRANSVLCSSHNTTRNTTRNTIKPKHMKNSNEFVSASRFIELHNETMNSL